MNKSYSSRPVAIQNISFKLYISVVIMIPHQLTAKKKVTKSKFVCLFVFSRDRMLEKFEMPRMRPHALND